MTPAMTPVLGAFSLLLLLLLLLLAGASNSQAAKGAAPEANATAHLEPKVVTIHIHSSINHVSREKMDTLYKENMDLDFAMWKDRKVDMKKFNTTAKQLQALFPDCYKRILIYNNTWYFADQPDMKHKGLNCPKPCNNRYPDIYLPLSRAMNHSLVIPNVIFLFNVCDCDQRHCSQAWDLCQVPVLQMLKYAAEDDEDHSILVPNLEQQPGVNFFPWDLKQDRAFFRGTPYPQYGPRHFDVHLRAHLANLSLHHPELLDVGMVSEYKSADPSVPVDLPVVPRVPIREHSRYRYLLNLDGVTASYRFSKLLSSNSIILKSHSNWIEFYYRSLQEGVNYFSVIKEHVHDVLDIIPQVRNFVKEKPAEAQTMILANIDFFQTYLTLAPRLVYWQEALARYKDMFPDMDAYIANIVHQHGL